MANYKAVSSGVWSALARWQDDSSGSYVASTVLPGAADVVYANNFTVTLDIDVVVSQLRTTSATNVNAGGLFDFGAANSVTANITGGTSACVRNNTANNKAITGNLLAGTTLGRAATNTSTGTLIINGNCQAGTGTNAECVVNDSQGNIIITGNVTGGSGNTCQGARNRSTGNITINGTSTGGSGTGCQGSSNESSGNFTITKVIASINNSGVNSVTINTIITEAEDASNGRQACEGLVRYSNSGQLQHTVTRQNGTQQLLTDNSTVNYPIQADVRNLVQYGPGNIYTGTLIPDITPQDIFTAIATSSDPIAVRLRNVATVQTTGDQIAAAL